MLRAIRMRVQRWVETARRVYAVDVLWRAAKDFHEQNGTTSAAAISYYVLFSLFPLLIVLVAVFGLIVRDPEIQEQVVDAIVEQIPQEVNLREQVETVVAGVAEARNGLLGLIGLLGTAWTASGMFTALRRALNRAFDVPGMRSFLHGKAIDLVSIIGVTGLAALSVLTTTVLSVFQAWTRETIDAGVSELSWWLLARLVPFAMSFITFLAVYRLIPNVTARFRELWVGALLATVGFEAAKAGFGFYVTRVGSYEVYGALGVVVAFLFLVYVVASIVMFAAEVTSEMVKD
ncbi:MAG: YihY/virulence factor BrkB family protein, partial [Dehalococcoidia bacterium]